MNFNSSYGPTRTQVTRLDRKSKFKFMDKKQVKHVRDTGLFKTFKNDFIVLVCILCPAFIFFINLDKVSRKFEQFNQVQKHGIFPARNPVSEPTSPEGGSTKSVFTKSVFTKSILKKSDFKSTETQTNPSTILDQTSIQETFPKFGDPSIKYNPTNSTHWIGEDERVPFYVYNSSVFQWLENCKLDPNNQLEKHKKFKHGDDVLFAQQIKNHPFRTFDPNEAKIFVIPIIWAYLYRYQNCRPSKDYTIYKVPEVMHLLERYRKDGNAEKSQLYHWENAVAHSLFKEPYFSAKGGHDHFMLASDYHIREPMALSSDFKKMMKNISYGYMEDWPNINFNVAKEYRHREDRFWRCTVVVPYVDRVISYDFSPDFASWQKRRFTFFFAGQWDKRVGYKIRKVLAKCFNPKLQ